MELRSKAPEFRFDLAVWARGTDGQEREEVAGKLGVVEGLEECVEQIKGQDEDVSAAAVLEPEGVAGLGMASAGTVGKSVVEVLDVVGGKL